VVIFMPCNLFISIIIKYVYIYINIHTYTHNLILILREWSATVMLTYALLCSLLMHYWTSLCVLRRTCRQE
jgi:hypothetical protein